MLRDVAKQARPVIILQRACQPMARAAARIHLRCRAHNQHAAEEMYGLRLRWDVDVDLDPAVLRPACGGGIVRDGSGRARAFDEHLPLVDAAARQDVADRLGTAERKLLVMRGSPLRIRKTQDAEAVLRILGEDVAEARKLFRVFICSASTPPGGGVRGMCGYYAARSSAWSGSRSRGSVEGRRDSSRNHAPSGRLRSARQAAAIPTPGEIALTTLRVFSGGLASTDRRNIAPGAGIRGTADAGIAPAMARRRSRR